MVKIDFVALIEDLGIDIEWVTDCSVVSFSHVTCKEFSGSLQDVMKAHLDSLSEEPDYDISEYLGD